MTSRTRNNLLFGLLLGAFFVAVLLIGRSGFLACDPNLSRAQYEVCAANL